MIFVCCSLLNSQNISINSREKRLVTWTPRTQLKKLWKLHSKRSNTLTMVSFILNGNKITTWKGYNFKTKSTKSKATFLRYEHLFRISSCRSLDQHKDTGVVRKFTKTAIFIATPMKKHIYQFILPKGVLCQFVDRKVVTLIPKYYLLAGDTSQVSVFFFLQKIHKYMSKQCRFIL